ncbi:Alpha-(1-_3)-arabinofuranosyltransferase [Mycolicibacterium aubagnense]
MPPSPVQRVLVVPESVNPGWTAHTAGGAVLTPVTINGWQQGWVLPAGTAGLVTLTFALNTPYRIGLFGGLALLPLLALLALLPMRRPVEDKPTNTWQPRPAVVGVALVGFGFLVAGWAGLATMVAGIGIRYLLKSRVRWLDGWTVVASAAGLVGAGAMLSAYPWRSVDGYVGHSPWVQFLALISVAALATSLWDAPKRSSA